MYGHDAFARTDSGDTSDHILRIRLSAAGMIPDDLLIPPKKTRAWLPGMQ